MAGKCRPSLREKTLEIVKHSILSQTNKDCIAEVFKRYEEMQREGHWEVCSDEYEICSSEFVCSNCKESFVSSELTDEEFLQMMKFCPNCGAKMKGANQ